MAPYFQGCLELSQGDRYLNLGMGQLFFRCRECLLCLLIGCAEFDVARVARLRAGRGLIAPDTVSDEQ